MRPSRMIVGDVRQQEALDLLIALNSGLPGMGTIHAKSAREAITKMCTLPLLAGENIGSRFVVPTVASSIDLVVHISADVVIVTIICPASSVASVRSRDRGGPQLMADV